MSQFLSKLVAEGRAVQVYSSIHAIIPKALAGCFVCRQPGDFAAQFVAGESRLRPDELRKFWILLRERYAIDLRDRERATAEIEARVMEHLRLTLRDAPPSQ